MKLLIAAAAASLALVGTATAAPFTIQGVNFASSDAASRAWWAQGGVSAGLVVNHREACTNPLTGPPPNTGPGGLECRALEAQGLDVINNQPYFPDFIELDENGVNPDDVIAFEFPNPIINGAGSCLASANGGVNGPANAAAYAGCDLIIFELLDDDDNPTLGLTLQGVDNLGADTEILGVLLAFIPYDSDGDGNIEPSEELAIWGFDLAGLGLAVGAAASNPLFVGRQVGSPDIAAVVGLNFGQQQPVIPLPAAAPLFFAGLAGLGFAAGRRRKK